jgi:RNA polymerase sigma factor (TIGR02999 family)
MIPVTSAPVSELTQILERVNQGDPASTAELLPVVYEELRKLAAQKMAGEPSSHTLQPTALVHEAWLRLAAGEPCRWEHRGHFFAAAAEAMRRILIDHARRKKAVRHGGGLERVELDELSTPEKAGEDTLLSVDEALQLLTREDSIAAEA